MRLGRNGRHILLASASVLLLLLVSAYIFVHTPAFNRIMVHEIIAQAEKSTGAEVNIGKTLVHWSGPRIDFYDVALRAPSAPKPTLFSCEHLGVSLNILSIWKRRFNLKELIVDRPVLRIVVDAQGQTNLPHPNAPSSSESTTDRLFDIAVRHLQINAGQIVYKNDDVPVSMEIRDLRTTIQFNRTTQSYEGSLAYDHGKITARTISPFEHEAQIEFVANRSELSVRSIVLSTGNTHLFLQGNLTDYSRPRIHGSYRATIFTTDLARILNQPSLPDGEIHTGGSLNYDASSNQSILDAITIAGSMDSPGLFINTGGISARAREIRANYALQHSKLQVQGLAGNVLGGNLTANLSMSGLTGRQSGRLSAALRGGSLSGLTQIVPAREREGVQLEGRLNAEVQADWTGAPTNATAHARVSIYGPLNASARHVVPVNGSVDVRYDGVHDTATFAPSTLRTLNTQISVSGILSRKSSLKVQVNARDLHELGELASSLSAGGTKGKSGSNSPIAPDLRGSALFAGQIAGSPGNPSIRGRLTGNDIVADGTTWRAVQADVGLSASGFSLANVGLSGPGQTSIVLNGRAGLQNWSFTPASQFSISGHASGISLTDVERIAKLQYPIAGQLTANLSVRGTERNPTGEGTLEISKGSAWGEAVNHLSLKVQGDRNCVHAAAQIQIPAGAASADVTYGPQSHEYDARVNAPKLVLDQIRILHATGVAVGGTASISANGKGTIDRPQASAELEIPELHIEDQHFSQLRAQLSVGDQHANFSINSTLARGYVQSRGDIDLRGDDFVNASMDVRALPLGPLLAAYAPKVPHGFDGETEIHATLSGPLKHPQAVKAQVQIPTLDLGYQSLHIGLAQPMKLAYSNGILSIDSADLKGNGTEISLRGDVPVKSAQPMNVVANATLDLSLLQSFSSDIKSSGQIQLRATAAGQLSNAKTRGELRIVNAQFSSGTVPLTLESVNGQIHASGNRIEIDRLEGAAGGGNISASGFLVYGRQPTFNVSAKAQSIRLRYPEGIRSILDANLNLTGSQGSSSLTGRVLVDRLSFTQQFDLANLMGQLSSETPSASPSAFEQNMKLNVAVATSNELNLTSSKLSVGGNANLTVNGNLGDPVILGRISLTQGEVFFMGKRYEIDNGTIAFANPTRTEPVINLYAKTTVQQYNITLNFSGPIDRLRTNYTSDPPLSQSDIISLIAFGQTAEQAATSPSTPPSVGAESVLAQGVSSQVSGKLEKIAGISQVTLDPLATNSQSNPGAQVAIQQRVSGSLLLTFSTDVTSTQAQTVEVQYTPNKKWTISIIRDQNGGYGIDARIRKEF